jgi:hypothetical protein
MDGRPTRELVRAGAGQQLEEEDPRRVDVRGRGHCFTADLLGTRILGREQGRAWPGQGRVQNALVAVEELRDTEVEQLHPAVSGNEDVAGLHVPVHDQVAMSVGQRLGHLPHQQQTIPHREALRVGVFVDRNPVDVLHHEEGCSPIVDAYVVQPCDVRMLEAGEDALLGQEPMANVGMVTRSGDDLERHFPVRVPVPTLGQVHGPHSTTADSLEDRVGTDLGGERRFDGRIGQG